MALTLNISNLQQKHWLMVFSNCVKFILVSGNEHECNKINFGNIKYEYVDGWLYLIRKETVKSCKMKLSRSTVKNLYQRNSQHLRFYFEQSWHNWKLTLAVGQCNTTAYKIPATGTTLFTFQFSSSPYWLCFCFNSTHSSSLGIKINYWNTSKLFLHRMISLCQCAIKPNSNSSTKGAYWGNDCSESAEFVSLYYINYTFTTYCILICETQIMKEMYNYIETKSSYCCSLVNYIPWILNILLVTDFFWSEMKLHRKILLERHNRLPTCVHFGTYLVFQQV